jgi:hypothetical protein
VPRTDETVRRRRRVAGSIGADPFDSYLERKEAREKRFVVISTVIFVVLFALCYLLLMH